MADRGARRLIAKDPRVSVRLLLDNVTTPVYPMEGPGLGTGLVPSFFKRPDLTTRFSEEPT